MVHNKLFNVIDVKKIYVKHAEDQVINVSGWRLCDLPLTKGEIALGMNFDQDACRVVKYRIAELCGYYVLLRPGQLFTPCPCCQSLVSLTVDRRAICTCGLTM
jgi:hypothetical protein